MLAAYYDESGTHSGAMALSIAGYISTVEKWENFQIEWLKMRDDEGYEYFHMADLESLKGQFSRKKGWNEDRKIAVLQRAHDIINRNTLKGIESSLIWSDYNELIPTYTGKHPPPAYAILVNLCMNETAAWARRNGYNEPINYVFEDGVKGVGWVLDVIQHARKFPTIRNYLFYGGFTYEDKKDVIQLQAADVNAYETWKHMENQIVQGNLRKIRDSALNLKGRDGFWVYHLDREALSLVLSDLAEVDFE